MGRLPFDPDKMRGATPPGPRTPRKSDEPMTVAALASHIENAIARAFPARVTVRGEISGARHRTHWYFNLKDESAVIAAIMFASSAGRSTVRPADGAAVIARGRLDYYKPQGRLSLIVDSLTPDGAGTLDARFRALCEELRKLGWFDPETKADLPPFPRRIAVLTSDSSAALRDVLDTTRRRCPAVDLLLVDIPVQGERAARTIAQTIRRLDENRERLRIDAIILTRGGGSPEDLWCFNDRDLARAIHECRIPLVAAIGHESDTTVAELVADRRAATPTQAAMVLTPERDALTRQLDAIESRLARTLRLRLDAERRHLEAIARRPVLADPGQIHRVPAQRLDTLAHRLHTAPRRLIDTQRQRLDRIAVRLQRRSPHAEHARHTGRLDALAARLDGAIGHALNESRHTLDRLAAVLEAVGPAAVLARGYSITTGDDGAVIRTTDQARPGDRIITRLADGTIRSTVDDGPANTRTEPNPPRRRPTRRRATRKPPRDEPPTLDLFSAPE